MYPLPKATILESHFPTPSYVHHWGENFLEVSLYSILLCPLKSSLLSLNWSWQCEETGNVAGEFKLLQSLWILLKMNRAHRAWSTARFPVVEIKAYMLSFQIYGCSLLFFSSSSNSGISWLGKMTWISYYFRNIHLIPVSRNYFIRKIHRLFNVNVKKDHQCYRNVRLSQDGRWQAQATAGP